MTQALCFNCGCIKFGALLPCSECQAAPTGSEQLDILFTDHYMSAATLKRFGGFIQKLNAASSQPELRLWTFIGFVSEYHPSIMTADVPTPFRQGVSDLLARVEIPEIVVEPGKGNRPWWQFWPIILAFIVLAGAIVLGLANS